LLHKKRTKNKDFFRVLNSEDVEFTTNDGLMISKELKTKMMPNPVLDFTWLVGRWKSEFDDK
ncbi:MAG: hypothetical protein ACFFBD_19425, partial [Candidatus Hodarchaeota archaeon]